MKHHYEDELTSMKYQMEQLQMQMQHSTPRQTPTGPVTSSQFYPGGQMAPQYDHVTTSQFYPSRPMATPQYDHVTTSQFYPGGPTVAPQYDHVTTSLSGGPMMLPTPVESQFPHNATSPHVPSHMTSNGPVQATTTTVRPQKLRSYDGKEEVKDYVKYLSRVGKSNGWDENVQASQWEMALEGEAMRAWNDADLECSLSNLVQTLQDRFNPKGYRSIHQSEFENLRIKEGEQYNDFAEKLRRKCSKAYPDFDHQVREHLAIEQFIKQLDPRIKSSVKVAMDERREDGRSYTLNEATAQAARHHTATITPEQLQPKPQTHGVYNITSAGSCENDMKQILQQFSQQLSQLTQQPGNNKKPRPFKGSCWYCNQPGHRQQHCKKYLEDVAAGRALPPVNGRIQRPQNSYSATQNNGMQHSTMQNHNSNSYSASQNNSRPYSATQNRYAAPQSQAGQQSANGLNGSQNTSFNGGQNPQWQPSQSLNFVDMASRNEQDPWQTNGFNQAFDNSGPTGLIQQDGMQEDDPGNQLLKMDV